MTTNTVMSPEEGLRHRIGTVHKLAEELAAQFTSIEEEMHKVGEELHASAPHTNYPIRYYSCGRNCDGCPHPSLSRSSLEILESLSPEEREIRLALFSRFQQLKRRRARLMKLLQSIHMSVYRLGGVSHRAGEPISG